MAAVYRKSALERISSPEQLDKAITVTSPMSWLALGAATMIVIVTLLWACLSKMPLTVSGRGIVAAPTETNSVYAPGVGQIIEINVERGNHFRAGDVLARYRVGSLGDELTIRAPQDGTATTILVKKGANVSLGEDILRFTPALHKYEEIKPVVVCYIGQSEAGKLKPGMKVKVYLDSADSQTYGFMEGEIMCVEDYAATETGMSYVLGPASNGKSSEFRRDNSSVVAVTCQLKQDKNTRSGYYWSGKRGKDKQVDINASVSVKFIVEEVHPIDFLFSQMKKALEGNH